jgi:hypothetical protein
MESALIHLARQVGSRRGVTRNAQGAYDQELVTGPWIPARVMERGAVAAKSRAGGQQPSSEARVQRGYELLVGPEDEAGADVERPTASSTFETDCPALGSPTIELSGEPEVLNDGEDLIGYVCFGDVPEDRS